MILTWYYNYDWCFQVGVVQQFEDDGNPRYYNLETLLPDYENFKKWNTNCGYVNEADYSSTLDAFCHWTYDFTNGYLVVVDLQGISKEDSYILTTHLSTVRNQNSGGPTWMTLGCKCFSKPIPVAAFAKQWVSRRMSIWGWTYVKGYPLQWQKSLDR